jgi:hypothetical protein
LNHENTALLDITEEELAAICCHWQERLRLRDWTVTVRLVRHHQLSQSGRDGEISIFADAKIAEMRVLTPRDRPTDCIEAPDPEETIVHELLHIHTHELSRYHKPSKRRAEEQAITALAAAFISLHRFRPDLAPTTTTTHEEPQHEAPSPSSVIVTNHVSFAPGTDPSEIGRKIAERMAGERDAATDSDSEPRSHSVADSEPITNAQPSPIADPEPFTDSDPPATVIR